MNTQSVSANLRTDLGLINEFAAESAKAWERANDGSRSTRSRSAQQRRYERLVDECNHLAKENGWSLDWPGLYPSFTDKNGFNHINTQSAIKFGGDEREVTSIQVIGARHFDSPNGNTYHNVKVSINGEDFIYGKTQYGYDRQYYTTALELLRELGIALEYSEKPEGIKMMESVSDGYSMRDLDNGKF